MIEKINIIAQAIKEHAEIRPYDLWILGIAVATFVASIIVAIFSYKLNKKQSQISEQQNRIALFKERLTTYNLYKQLYKNVWRVSRELDNLPALKTYNDRDFANLLNNLFYEVSEPVSKLMTHQPTLVIEEHLNKFAELEELLDMVDYLFTLDTIASNQVSELRKSLKELRKCMSQPIDIIEVDKKLKSVLTIINDDTTKETMKKQLYISKKDD